MVLWLQDCVDFSYMNTPRHTVGSKNTFAESMYIGLKSYLIGLEGTISALFEERIHNGTRLWRTLKTKHKGFDIVSGRESL